METGKQNWRPCVQQWASATRASAPGRRMLPLIASADWKMNLQRRILSVAQQMFDLHTLITLICVSDLRWRVGVVLLRSTPTARARAQGRPVPRKCDGRGGLDHRSVLHPAGYGLPGHPAVLDMRDSSAPEMTVKITATSGNGAMTI